METELTGHLSDRSLSKLKNLTRRRDWQQDCEKRSLELRTASRCVRPVLLVTYIVSILVHTSDRRASRLAPASTSLEPA